MESAVLGLPRYTFAYYNRATRQVTTGDANRLNEIFQSKGVDSESDPGSTDERMHGIFRRVTLPRG